ncbi:Threonine/homoserine/homoserine lactone efflux protein [Roseivivax lentus]|uniref:Threonine/homoserine/homoserine lactone efflux protein n=1 Tax=Roseivivax lentus TaxID=633194 RepID=A0A1N7MRN0_9RHOB|nr:LysE family transporter [Roseivivax lentus]SIS88795.1 Threonine/homoserine/homoserine lactone efflux protein [Roseivivax lentus]
MEVAHLIAFNLTLLAAMAAPGPALLFALRQSIAGGFRAGFATGLGLAVAAVFWTSLALAGLEAVFVVVPAAYLVLKIGGALYLLYVAYTLWRDAQKPLAETAHPGRRAFLGGMLVNLSNPKSVLFAASVLVVIFPAGLSVTEKALILANHFAVEVVVYGLFAALLATPPARAGYLRLKAAIDRIAAAVLGALGLRLLLDR